jgi:hypothetical protein
MRFVRRGLKTGLLGAVFAVGYLCGTTTHPTAQAQMGDLMQKAGESGGALGSAAKLGTTITDMKDSLDKLNKNMGTLEEIKKALGG